MAERDESDGGIVYPTLDTTGWSNNFILNNCGRASCNSDVAVEYGSATSAFLVADEADRIAQSDLLEAQRRAEHASLQRLIASKRVHETRARYEAAMRLAGKPTPPLRTIVDEEVALHDAQL